MDAYAAVLLIAIPFFVILIIIEATYAYFVKKKVFKGMDIIASLTSGLTNTLKDVMGLSLVIIGYGFVLDKLAIVTIEATWAHYVLGFIAIDFASYWSHRMNHSVNYFWNTHLVHHSSEHFNLPVALRQTISNLFSIYAVFLIPAAILGLPASVIGVIAPIHLFMQFWYHTEMIGKMGFLEYIIVTPSQHRVHHAINERYIDKNLAAIFCIWDRMFGTFQEELDEEPVVYGVKKPVRTWNPFKINFMHLWGLVQDAWHTSNYFDKLRIWFMPTGWRPNDVVEAYPVKVIEDVYAYENYDPPTSSLLRNWSWVQLVVANLFNVILLLLLAKLPVDQLLFYGFFAMFSIYCYSSLMDLEKHAFYLEAAKNLLGLVVIFTTGTWFGAETVIPFGTHIVAGYFVLSTVVVGYISRKELSGLRQEMNGLMGRVQVEA